MIQFIISEDPRITMIIFPFNTMHMLFSIVFNILLAGKYFLENEIRCHCTQSMTINLEYFHLVFKKAYGNKYPRPVCCTDIKYCKNVI